MIGNGWTTCSPHLSLFCTRRTDSPDRSQYGFRSIPKRRSNRSKAWSQNWKQDVKRESWDQLRFTSFRFSSLSKTGSDDEIGVIERLMKLAVDAGIRELAIDGDLREAA